MNFDELKSENGYENYRDPINSNNGVRSFWTVFI